jgi:hypothetical protein
MVISSEAVVSRQKTIGHRFFYALFWYKEY